MLAIILIILSTATITSCINAFVEYTKEKTFFMLCVCVILLTCSIICIFVAFIAFDSAIPADAPVRILRVVEN